MDSGSFDARVKIGTNEQVDVVFHSGTTTGRLFLLAPNGGSINGAGNKASVQAIAGTVHFTFKAGQALGGYTVEISDGRNTQTLSFWQGPEPSRGRPGPNLTFTH